MKAIIPASIESLEIKYGQSLNGIYFPIVAGHNHLRKFKVSFSPPDEAKKRAYRYWQHYMLQKRLTFDFLRCDTIILDELDIRGDFGEPTLNPVEFSGLSTDLYFAVQAQAKSLVKLQVVNNDIDFSLAEIGSIIVKAENLTQLGVTCRAFKHQDRHGNWIEQGLGVSLPPHSHNAYLLTPFQTHRNFERLLGLLGGNGTPFSLTILRTHYNILDEAVYDRDGADRRITATRSPLELEAIAKKMVERGLPLAHLGIFAEALTNAYGIFGAEWDEYLYAFELRDVVLQKDVDGVFKTYEEFEEVNRGWIERIGVEMPRAVEGPPVRRLGLF